MSTDSKLELYEWRRHETSLTAKLEEKVGGSVLEILEQGWTSPGEWETHCLAIQEQFIFQRQIIISHQQIKYWYGRTIIPYSCYQLNPDFFKRLEKESLRYLIFDEPQVERVKKIDYPIDEHSLEFSWVRDYVPSSERLWVRLAEFSFQQQGTFYLAEVLFPSLAHLT